VAPLDVDAVVRVGGSAGRGGVSGGLGRLEGKLRLIVGVSGG